MSAQAGAWPLRWTLLLILLGAFWACKANVNNGHQPVVVDGSELTSLKDEGKPLVLLEAATINSVFGSKRMEQRVLGYLRIFADAGGAQFAQIDTSFDHVCLGDNLIPTRVLLLSFDEDRAQRACPQNVSSSALDTEEYLLCFAQTEVSILSQGNLVKINATTVVAQAGPKVSLRDRTCPRGQLYAIFAMLHNLDFNFLRGLRPNIGNFSTVDLNNLATFPFERVKPRWPFRATHYHTMHPLELTNVLNGWGKIGPEDEQGFQELLVLYENFLEWLVAQRQNAFEFAILRGDSWSSFVYSELRQTRLALLTEIAHDFCVEIGFDSPLTFVQQHALPLVTNILASEKSQETQIKQSIDWLVATGIDFLGTESGLNEYTRTSCTDMLRWMNIATQHATEVHNIKILIKCHCSTGQSCPEFNNINFNFLPQLARKELAIAPHTVQFYTLDDPTPGVYGNTNFSYMLDFMIQSAETGRAVIYYPETEYWVDFDSPVPLFLPLYARARLHDLQLIAAHELEGGAKVQGQMNFDSGFEWSYWINSVVTAQAVFDPLHKLVRTHGEGHAFRVLLQDTIAKYMCRQQNAALQLASIIADVSDVMHAEMVEAAGRSADWGNRTAIVYITGDGTLSDLGRLDPQFSMNSPRLDFKKVLQDPETSTFFLQEVRPRLLRLEHALAEASSNLTHVRHNAARPGTEALWNELYDSLEITRLRTSQVRNLYESLASSDNESAQKHFETAKRILDEARTIVQRREQDYAIATVAQWAPQNPTSYKYRYLWTVHTLYYWFRDEASVDIVRRGGFVSPCFMNKEDLLEEVITFPGSSTISWTTEIIRSWFAKVPLVHHLTECLSPPDKGMGPFHHRKSSPIDRNTEPLQEQT